MEEAGRQDLSAAQRELTEAMVEELFAAAPFGLALFDLGMRFVRVNEFLARINGLPAAGHVGRRFSAVRPDISSIVEPLLQQVIETGSAVSDVKISEIPETASDRVLHTVAVYYPLRGRAGDTVGVGSIVLDVTELRVLEEQLQRAGRLEAVGLLAGGVAHDFNNLLTVISGHAALALAAMPKGGEGRDDVEGVAHAAERAAEVVRNLLAFARQADLRPRPVDLDSTLRELATLIRPTLGPRVELVHEPGGASGPALVDPVQLQQVLVNLAVNAGDAMPDGGTLTLRTLTLEAGDEEASVGLRPGRYVGISVADTGTGMDEETLGRVFEPFFTTKGMERGTGLGLSTAHGIVAQSGGEIRAVSAPGSGSTFTVLLPCADSAPGLAGTTRATEPGSGSETIMLVEDEDMLRTLAERQLTRLGYTVVCAASGEEALALIAGFEGEIDLVVTDLVIPGLTGQELVRRLRRERPALRVLYMSGSGTVRDESEAADELLAKPFSLETLGRAVRRELDGAS
jgi:signal transduction histidine kinase/CheY-like chemotaxis protein